METIANLCLAFILDAILGDPEWFPHPVRAVGICLNALERGTTAVLGRTKLAGVVAGVALVAGAVGAVAGSIALAELAGPAVAWGVQLFWLWAGISAGDLDKAASIPLRHLENGDIRAARRALANIVGRDTSNLDADAIRAAVVETVAENTVDGVLSPIFYAAIGGAPLLWAFKAISTGDSMVGYKNEKYRDFGWFSARLDDAANYIPARLSPLFIAIAAFLEGRYAVEACVQGYSLAKKHESPNAGFPEAAMAGALGVSVGGPAIYNGEIKQKPLLGLPNAPPPSMEDAKTSITLMWEASVLFLAAIVAIVFFAGKIAV